MDGSSPKLPAATGAPSPSHLHTYTLPLRFSPIKVRFPSPAPIEFFVSRCFLTGDADIEKTGLQSRFFCVWNLMRFQLVISAGRHCSAPAALLTLAFSHRIDAPLAFFLASVKNFVKASRFQDLLESTGASAGKTKGKPSQYIHSGCPRLFRIALLDSIPIAAPPSQEDFGGYSVD